MTPRIAVFVDAGYLCMAGASTLGGPVYRRNIHLDIQQFLKTLYKHSILKDFKQRGLLRIYWYDSCPSGTRKTPEQATIETQPYVKLRLGSLNRDGKQKGVDTMLVLDLFELAITGKITDALVLSGDEDLKPGIERAQAHGVRVHLLGVGDAHQANQSNDLIAEADTSAVWNTTLIKPFLTITTPDTPMEDIELPEDTKAQLQKIAQDTFQALNLDVIKTHREQGGRGMPGDIDGRLLVGGRTVLGRDLDYPERKYIRDYHTALVDKALPETVSPVAETAITEDSDAHQEGPE